METIKSPLQQQNRRQLYYALDHSLLRGEVGMMGAWEARVLGRFGVSRVEHGEIILEPMAWDEGWRKEGSSKMGWSQGRRF